MFAKLTVDECCERIQPPRTAKVDLSADAVGEKLAVQEHEAKFNVVPLEFATDNGAMIAWTGVLAFTHGLVTPLDESFVKLRWRVDKVDVPWIH